MSKRISDLDVSPGITPAALIEVEQGGASFKNTIQDALDLIIVANVGAGATIFRDESPTNTFNLKSIIGGTNVTVDNNANDITINSTGGGATTLPALTDVTIISRAANEVLVVNSGNTQWVNALLSNANIDASAAIAYSKLNLTGAILNADLAGGIVYSKLVLTGAILNADLAGSIQLSKLENVTSGQIIVGSAGNVPTAVVMSGDIAIIASGATTIQDDAVDIAMLSATGTPDGTTFLRGDNTWSVPAGSGDMVLASVQTSTGKKTFAADATLAGLSLNSQVPSAPVNGDIWRNGNFIETRQAGGTRVIVTENLAQTLVSKTLTTPTIVATGFTNMQHTHQAANTGGQLVATLALTATGTKDATTFLRGDNTWAIPAGGSQTPWTSDIDAATNSLLNLDILDFNDNVDAPTAAAAQMYWESAFGMIWNVPTGHVYDWQWNGTAKYELTETEFDFGGNDLEDFGRLMFSGGATGDPPLSTFPAIWFNTVADIMGFHVQTGKSFNYQINLIEEYDYDATRADFNSNNIINLGTLNTHTVPGGTSTFALISDKLDVFAATTSLELLGVISDETGTGLLVFNSSPVIITPTIASFANAAHDHEDAAGGGQLTATDALDATGTPDGTNFLRGDNTWAVPGGSGDMVLASVQTSTGKKTFAADATNAGFNLNSQTPSATVAGDIWRLVDNLLMRNNADSADITFFSTANRQTAIVNSEIDAGAAIVLSKLENLTSGQIIVGSAGNVPTAVVMSGDIAIIASGATTIQVDAVDIAMLSATGTPDGTTFLRGDNTWSVPGGSGDMVLATAQTSTGKKSFTTDATNAGLAILPLTGDPSALVNGDVWIDDTGTDVLKFRTSGATRTITDNINRQTAIVNSEIDGAAAIAFSKLEVMTSGNILVGSAGNVATEVTMSGDVFIIASGATTIQDEAVTLAKMAHIATASILGRVTAATGDVEVLTSTQATTLINVFTSGLKGLVPASGGSATEFLSADGTFKVPAGGGDMVLADVQTVTGAKTFGTIGGAVGKLILAGSTSGSTIVNAAATAGTTTITFPGTTGTVVIIGLANQLTNTEITAGAYAKITGVGTLTAGVWNATDIVFANLQQIATDRLVGRDTAATGDMEELTVGGGVEFTGSGGIQTSALTGDVTKAAGGTATTIAVDAVDIAMLSATGTPDGTTFLRGDNTWSVPAGGEVFTWTADHDANNNDLLNFQSLQQNGTQSLTGAVRLVNTGIIGWRNAANDGDITLQVDANNRFKFSQDMELEDTTGVLSLDFRGFQNSILADNVVIGKIMFEAQDDATNRTVFTEIENIMVDDGHAGASEAGAWVLHVRRSSVDFNWIEINLTGDNEFNVDVPSGGLYRWDVDGTTEMLLDAAAITLSAGNNLLMGAASLEGYIELGELTGNAATPAANFGRIFLKLVTDHSEPFYVDEAGTVTGLIGGGSAHVIENQGSPLTARANLNFIGAIVVASDNDPDTDVTIGGTKTNFDTALSDGTFAFLNQANVFTLDQTIEKVNSTVILTLYDNVTTPTDDVLVTSILFNADRTTGANVPFAQIDVTTGDVTDATSSGVMDLQVRDDDVLVSYLSLDGELGEILANRTITIQDVDSPATMKFYDNQGTPSVGSIANFTFRGDRTVGQDVAYAQIEGRISNVTDATSAGTLNFKVRDDDAVRTYAVMNGDTQQVLLQPDQVKGLEVVVGATDTTETNIVIGAANVLLTSATDGFLFISNMAGTPVGTPTTFTGKTAIVFDDTNDLLYAWDGAAWKNLTGGGSQTPWASDIDAADFSLNNLDKLEFNNNADTPVITQAEIYYNDTTTGMNFNSKTGDGFMFRVNGGAEVSILSSGQIVLDGAAGINMNASQLTGVSIIIYNGTVSDNGNAILRTSNDNSISWRNAGNSANVDLKVNASDQFEFSQTSVNRFLMGAALAESLFDFSINKTNSPVTFTLDANHTTLAANDVVGTINFSDETITAPAEQIFGQIRTIVHDPANASYDGEMLFSVGQGGSLVQYMIMNEDGDGLIDVAKIINMGSSIAMRWGNSNDKRIMGDGGGLEIEAPDGQTIDLQVDSNTIVNVNETFVDVNVPVMMLERAAAIADLATFGQLWVLNTVPNALMFTDDDGIDSNLTRGVHDIPTTAASWFLPTLEPATGITNINFATNDHDYKVFEFTSTAADERIQMNTTLPRNIDLSDIDVIIKWSFASGSGVVRWGIRAVGMGDNDALDSAWGTAIEANDTAGTAEQFQFVTLAALAVGGTPGEGDEIAFEVYREGSDAGDTFSGTARIHSVTFRVRNVRASAET